MLKTKQRRHICVCMHAQQISEISVCCRLDELGAASWQALGLCEFNTNLIVVLSILIDFC